MPKAQLTGLISQVHWTIHVDWKSLLYGSTNQISYSDDDSSPDLVNFDSNLVESDYDDMIDSSERFTQLFAWYTFVSDTN